MTQIVVKQADFTQNSYVGRIVQEDMYGLPLMYDVKNGLYFISKTCEAGLSERRIIPKHV